MRTRTERTSIIDQDRQLRLNQKKIKIAKRANQVCKTEMINGSSCSISPSNLKNFSLAENDYMGTKQDLQLLGMGYFLDKYLLRDQKQENLKDQMKMLLNRKKNEIQSLRIYKDELKFISRNQQYSEPVKLSVQILKEKAEVEEKLIDCKSKIEKQLRKADKELENLSEYQKYLQMVMEGSTTHNSKNYLDITKQQEVMLKNLEQEKEILIRELAEQQRKNAKQIKQIQDEILEYRIMIKDKEDYLRDLKAKICTLYIKLHSRNNSRTGSKSKDRNMSLSIRKFNNQNHNLIKEAYVGNNTFKNYSKQIIQKVSSEEELIKIKFFMSSSEQSEPGSKNRQQLFFQCFYKGRDGQVHDDRNQQPPNDEEATRDKISSAASALKFEEIYVKHLFSMKFFYKSKIVGVQCRIKTDKGNKHVYIGNCNPSIQHELLTLVNKKIVTLGSYWHGKQMIGISIWYSERLKTQFGDQPKKVSHKNQAYDQYYS